MIGDAATVRNIRHCDGDQARHAEDQLAVEEPLEIRIGAEPVAITMRTPGHDRDLAAGFCLTEGIVEHPDEIEDVEPCTRAEFGNVIAIRLTDAALARRSEQVARARRQSYLSSSCGLCGKQTLDRVRQSVPTPGRAFTVTRATLLTLPQRMGEAQTTFACTGGLHAAATFRPDGTLLDLREDIGRHNAVDKVIGAALWRGDWPMANCLLMVSGRASFEIMQKAAMAGIALVAAVSAPSSLAVDFAVQMDLTLVGFLRPPRMNVYHDPGRIAAPASLPSAKPLAL